MAFGTSTDDLTVLSIMVNMESSIKLCAATCSRLLGTQSGTTCEAENGLDFLFFFKEFG